MLSVSEFRAEYRRGKIVWPGGYTRYAFVDGDILCWGCLRSERRSILEALHDGDIRSGWGILGFDVPWEGPVLHCGHCSEEIPTEYGDPDEEDAS